MAPGGWIARVTPDGSHWELVSTGYRNTYDIAFNKAGELFAYDSDMEWDVGLPWYRPTRLVHATSGSEFGWRNGSGKWPDYYPDSLGSVVDVGRGSPTGIVFGYGADFPARYQRALFLCDWSYGRVFAAHLEPDGASYTAELEPFIQAAPFPVVDVTIGPDGAMYLITGGRSTESWLYRVTYEGDKPTRPVSFRPDPEPASARKLRHKLESYHSRQTPKAVDVAWPHLASGDRAIRYAARIALENQPVVQWRQRALNETNPQALITAMVALARHAESKQQKRIINALGRLSWPSLNTQQKLSLLRVYELCFTRLGEPGKAVRREVIDRLSRHYPADHFRLDRGLSRLLAYLEAPGVIEKTLERIEQATSQQEQIAYAYALRTVDKHWTLKQRKQFFRWFNKAATFRGGKSAQGYLDKIEADALAKVDKKTRKKLKPILEAEPKQPEVVELPRQGTVKNWKVEDLLPAVQGELNNRDFKRGKRMFAAAKCFECHRFNGRGGATGPDLTTVGQRFSRQYILESIINPSEAISNQFQATIITKKSGEVVVGRIVNMHGNAIQVQPNPFVPSHTVKINHDNVKSTRPSPTSMMPPGLINSLKKEEILDLMAYMLSRGDPDDPMFD
jgi:putative heme-binding domain-containing protein